MIKEEETPIADVQKDVQAGASDEGLDRKTLFVRSVPFEATSEQLSEFFSQFVPVRHAVVVNDDQGKSRGFGFVSFTMEEDTLTALVEAKNHKFQNRFLRVDVAKRRDRKDKDKASAPTPKVEREPVEKRRSRLIIRNLPWTCKNPDTLKKIFSRYGAVFDAYIPTKKGGQMRGFAFVVMKKTAAAEKAVKGCVGLKIDGREVAVDLALEKSKWEKVKDDEEIPEIKQESPEVKKEDVEEEEEEDGDEDDEEKDEDEEDEDEEDDFDKLNEVNSDDEPEDEEEEEAKLKPNRQEAYSVFVRNIPYDADEDSLKTHFEQFGPVKYALPVIDKNTGLARGSAFVAFRDIEPYEKCLSEAPATGNTSLLISDDVSPLYVYQGRILSITSAVDRGSANKLAERNALKRKETLGKAPGEKDKRNLFLLNEGRITESSKLAQVISKMDMELREKSYKLRVQQLTKNPMLHLSLTRLAIRNLPRSMNAKALKALGRKAVVNFATEVKENVRQPLSKEEISRSVKLKHELEGEVEKSEVKKKGKNAGVVKQAKVIQEVKGSGEAGRSRGYGFIEFRDHKCALMGLRWLNAHEVTVDEILEGLPEEEKKTENLQGQTKRKLIVEFAVENAQVVKRMRERVYLSRKKDDNPKKRKRDDDDEQSHAPGKRDRKKMHKCSNKKGNLNKGPKDKESKSKPESAVSEDVKRIIAQKRKKRKGKN